MSSKIKNILFLALFLASCSNSNNTQSTEKQDSQTVENQTKEEETVSSKTDCFRKETLFADGSGMKDIEELNLTIENQKVTGIYNWLPAEKDQRKGTFEGTLEENTIQATYTFMQEGKTETTSITLVLEDNKVTISSSDESLGINTTLEKVECQN
ncbi:hypothetical protein [Bernardetia sp. MNP-M8]|uniref:hypothetical protein n=1 Tax=Bernardetia sp. MNP-M8 TaxID=3127470 RepID=UPI0030CD10C7